MRTLCRAKTWSQFCGQLKQASANNCRLVRTKSKANAWSSWDTLCSALFSASSMNLTTTCTAKINPPVSEEVEEVEKVEKVEGYEYIRRASTCVSVSPYRQRRRLGPNGRCGHIPARTASKATTGPGRRWAGSFCIASHAP